MLDRRSSMPYLFALLLLWFTAGPTHADGVNGAQKTAAREFLAAVASGDAQAVAYAIHPAELEQIRTSLIAQLREEGERNDNTIRRRLFGPVFSVADLERLTPVGFYSTLARRLRFGGRQYEDAVWIAAIPDEKVVHVLLRGKQPKDRGDVQIVNVVTLVPYGKDWKAAVPSEIRAQIDDLVAGRSRGAPVADGGGAGATGAAGASGAAGAGPKPPANVPGVLELIDAARKSLVENRCADYYKQYLSPNFRRVTSAKAMDTLIRGCTSSEGQREMLATTLTLVRGLSPRYEYAGTRAVYDLSGQGLPYDRFVLEQVDQRWYIAE